MDDGAERSACNDTPCNGGDPRATISHLRVGDDCDRRECADADGDRRVARKLERKERRQRRRDRDIT